MKYKDVSGDRTVFLLVFDAGDRLEDELERFILAEDIALADFTAIGALASVELLAFDANAKAYETSVRLHEQCELASLIGNASRNEGKSAIHAHLTIGKLDGSAFAGHLKHAVVRPTCEMFLRVHPGSAVKQMEPAWNLALYRL